MSQRSRPTERDDAGPVEEVEPEVAAPDATFEPFPSPEPLPTGEPGDEDLGELVIGASDGPFTPTRTQWVGLAFASLAITAGAFAKVVFLGGTFG